jgi:hypothetical protein
VKNSFLIVSDKKNNSNAPVVIAVHCGINSKFGLKNVVKSIYGKDDIGRYLANEDQKGNIVYEDKKRAGMLRPSIGVQSPKVTANISSALTIPQPPPPVNTQNEKNQNNFKAAPAQSRPQHFTMAGGSLKKQVDEWRDGRGGAGAGAEKGKEGKGKDGRDGKN